jgi:hypothetical protein
MTDGLRDFSPIDNATHMALEAEWHSATDSNFHDCAFQIASDFRGLPIEVRSGRK